MQQVLAAGARADDDEIVAGEVNGRRECTENGNEGDKRRQEAHLNKAQSSDLGAFLII